MNFKLIVICIGISTFIDMCYSTPACYAPNFPLNKDVGCCSRKTPININTKKAKYVVTPPLKFENGENELASLRNTGFYVELIVDQKTLSTSTGGVFYNDSYTYHSNQFFWANSTNGTSGSKINGCGYPLEVHGIAYKTEYGSFEKALNYADGLFGLVYFVEIRSYDNPLFNNIAFKLMCITCPGASVFTNEGPDYYWFDIRNSTRNYYAYPAQYLYSDGQYYNCLTNVVYPRSTSGPWIGETQFKNTFLKINLFGGRNSNEQGTYPQAGRPVVCAEGIQDHYNFF